MSQYIYNFDLIRLCYHSGLHCDLSLRWHSGGRRAAWGRRRRRRGRRRPSLATPTPQAPRSRSRYQDGLTFLDGFLGRGSACSAACCCFRGFSSFICSKEGGKEKAPAKSGGGRRRRKWSKGKQKEKVNNAVLFDQATTYDKLLSEVIYLSSCSLYYVLCWLRCLSMSGISEQEHLRLSSCNVAVIWHYHQAATWISDIDARRNSFVRYWLP